MEILSLFEAKTLLSCCFAWLAGLTSGFSNWFYSWNIDRDSATTLAMVSVFLIGLATELTFQKERSGHRGLLRSYRTNLSLFFCNQAGLSLLSITAFYSIAEIFVGVDSKAASDLSIATWMILFTLLDFCLYLWHFASHHVDFLWMFHKVHHSDRSMNITTALRFHAGELILTTAFKALLVSFLGIPLDVLWTSQAIITCFAFFHHMNIQFRGERFLKWFLIVPYLHRLHHSMKRFEHDNNFGSVFSIWDRVFGTLCEKNPDAIGLSGVAEQNAWQAFVYGLSWQLPKVPTRPGPKTLASPRVARMPLIPERESSEAVEAWLANDAWIPRSLEPGEVKACAKRAYSEQPAITSASPANLAGMNDLFEFLLANVDFMHEVADAAWQFNLATIRAYGGSDLPKQEKNLHPGATDSLTGSHAGKRIDSRCSVA